MRHTGIFMLWDLTASVPGQHLNQDRAGLGRSYSTAIAFSHDGRQLALGTGNTTQLWDPASGMRQRTLEIPHGPTSHQNPHGTLLSFVPDGHRLAAFCTADQTVWLWDSATGQSKGSVRLKVRVSDLLRQGRESISIYAAFSPDMKLLATASRDTVELWDPLSGRRRLGVKGNDPAVSGVAFRRDGRVLAVRSTDDTMRLWDCDTGRNILTFKGTRDAVQGGAVVFGDELLATASATAVELWDAATGQHLQNLIPPPQKNVKRARPGIVRSTITCLAFSGDSHLFAAAETQHTQGGVRTLTHFWELTGAAW